MSGPTVRAIQTLGGPGSAGKDTWHILDALGNVVAYIDPNGVCNGFSVAEAGFTLTDIVTGKLFQLTVHNGAFQLTELT